MLVLVAVGAWGDGPPSASAHLHGGAEEELETQDCTKHPLLNVRSMLLMFARANSFIAATAHER